jgi:CrcB protein
MTTLLWVMTGGAAGSGARYLLTRLMNTTGDSGFPYGTLTVNVVGCLTIGFLASAFQNTWNVSSTTQATLLVGVLGGFTTFSSFSHETIQMFQSGRYGAALLYLLVSNAAGLAGILIGMKLAPAG